MESLLQATGLPAELLQQALAPLTEGEGEGEGVLLRSCAPGGERGAGPPLLGVLGGSGGCGGARGGVWLLGSAPGRGWGRALGWVRVWGRGARGHVSVGSAWGRGSG